MLCLIISEVKCVRFPECLNSALISALCSQHLGEQVAGFMAGVGAPWPRCPHPLSGLQSAASSGDDLVRPDPISESPRLVLWALLPELILETCAWPAGRSTGDSDGGSGRSCPPRPGIPLRACSQPRGESTPLGLACGEDSTGGSLALQRRLLPGSL